LRYLHSLPLLFVLCCAPAEPTPATEVVTVSGHVRYEQHTRQLRGELLLPDSTAAPPEFMGSAMEPLGNTPTRRFRLTLPSDYPAEVRFGVRAEGEMLGFDIPVSGVYIDSLPTEIGRDSTVRFPVAQAGLGENESLVIFFEPVDRGAPKRILVTGPTRRGVVTLPPSALADTPPGDYRVYLVKQQVNRDQRQHVKFSIQTEYFTRDRAVTINE
jgi:hypothetical protein